MINVRRNSMGLEADVFILWNLLQDIAPPGQAS